MITKETKKEYSKRKSREYRERHPGIGAELAKKWRERNPEDYKATNRRQNLRRIGCTPELYEEMHKEQAGKCKICSIPKNKLCVDHCHSTGKIRGLLCDNCNHGLGKFKDNTKLLEEAINYLKINEI